MKRLSLLLISLFACLVVQAEESGRMDLSGLWRFQLDPMGFGKTPGSELYLSKLTETITLPGSMDEGGKGIQNIVAHVDRLSRKFEYCGQAWYQREVVIPEDWKGKEVILSLERCHWETAVFVDGEPVATDERLSTPNRFILTKQLTPGLHTLTLCVDNRLKYPMDQWTHGTTEYTQTNWNGVAGRMELIAKPSCYIEKLDIYPDTETGKVKVSFAFHTAGNPVKGTLTLHIREKGGKGVCRAVVPVALSGASTIEHELALGKDMKLWDEFSPALYDLTATLDTEAGEDLRSSVFGMRHVEQGRHHVRLNGRDIHLRGVLDCCVFPITGYPATDVKEWKRIMGTVKDYGMNHIRFHSWCPPEAAFDAADELGLYLQVELPMWIKDVGRYPARRDFFEKEMYAILDEYGNHPSFILYCNGNENEGDFAVLEDLVKKGQAYDPRHLYSASTARTHVKADQYYASHVAANVGDKNRRWITVYEGKPSTDWDLCEESAIDVPVIAHETGQRCMYPNFEEMKKYTGVLEPRNFKVFQDRLARNGMLHQDDEFFRATGAHTVLQYKEVNEALLRTSTSGGFQLLGLSDFPGQGSAFVGILDAFWESKGLVTPEKFRESCAPVVLLARLPKRIYTNNETFTVKLGVYQFGPEAIRKGQLAWQLEGEAGDIVGSGKISHKEIPFSTVDSLGVVNIPLDKVTAAGKYTLKARIAGGVCNEWDIWVYPAVKQPASEGYTYVRQWEKAKELLLKGENVLLVPDSCAGRKAHFASHFWNPIMFNWKPMIVGTCIDHQHPAFRDFPTSYYADWQWWDILNYATAVDLTDMRTLTPVIQSIDTYEVNRKLGISFEANVAGGKLFVLCVDPEKDMEKRPAMQQLLTSVRNYVASDRFAPSVSLQPYELDALFDYSKIHRAETQSGEAIRQLLNQ
ncbi:beta-galactosidase [Parabacteroides acidifaciens]|uniref:Beta-galactosidase n=1 Tax=Parabacteroides acidifaciens TaxID=2290935 RepID=A0A3D8HHC1_9BACT|nr:beta-galactosidase [Parabacteroides acidifaciens]RDU50374.1 beta-galactosidase [Parabacteroides acidifaciens]